ncbi:chymotrypsin-like protease CTRL-1 [Chironomus tepperi]|uniref:chymotrypsin-like protease CTRL-1 n=1 Tax=Chironomus tepperi TaxID=113505 RepID=UPI00391EF33A
MIFPTTVRTQNYPTTIRPQKSSKMVNPSSQGFSLDSNMDTMDTEEKQSCGTRQIIHRGIGGEATKPGEYPWNVALTKPDKTFFCGGVLLDNNHVVTAAHCIIGKQNMYKFGTNDVVVTIGAHDLKMRERHRITVAVKSIRVHPDWNPLLQSYDADIAVLELVKSVQYTDYIQPICLIEPNSPISSLTDGEVVGFGKSEKANHETIAQRINTPIQSNEKCIKSGQHESLVSHRAFCGGSANGTGVCLGDSGSGLFVFKNGKFYLRGIVSASLRGSLYGCNVNTYAVFTDVIKFHSWVKSGGVHEAETKVQQLEAEIMNLRKQMAQRPSDLKSSNQGGMQKNNECECPDIGVLARGLDQS